MSLLTFNFCGVDAVTDLDLIVNDIKMPITPEISENIQNVPGMVGKLFLGNSYGQKIIPIDITIKAENSAERVKKIHEITELVMTFGSGEYPMVFSNDSEYTYYGHFTNISTPERISQTSSWAKCTLTFACSDPKGYGEYQQWDMAKNPTIIYPDGNGDCYPIFTCIPKKDVTKIAITDENGTYVYLGADVDPSTGDTPIDKEPLVFHDVCNTLATWTTVTNSTVTFDLEGGVIGGKMKSTPNSLKIGLTDDGKYADFGNPVSGKWHGACVMQWLPNSYQDYRIRVRLHCLQKYPRSKGKSELYLLDSNGARIGKIMLKDNGLSEEVVAQAQIGSHTDHQEIYYGYGTVKKGKKKSKTIKVGNETKKVTEKGKTKTEQQWKNVKLDEDTSTSTYTDFYGYIEIQKIGNKYRAEIMKLDNNSNPAWNKPVVKTWTDSKNKYTGALAGIAFYTAKYDITEDTANPVIHYTNNIMAISDVQVWNIINGGNGVSNVPVTIARNGDEVKFNCEDRTTYKNGNIFMKNLYIGSDFPTMQGGVPKTFAFEPDLNDADWYFEYRPTTK